jgi:hypothetical protein
LRILAITLLLHAGMGCALAQTVATDTTFIVAATKNSIRRYEQSIIGQSQLYNGADYFDYQPIKEEHPYFESDDWVTGSVHYDGFYYENIPLMYDIFKDQLISETYYSHSMMNLVKERITGFTLGPKTFVALKDSSMASGFYQVLYKGKVTAYARHIKTFREIIASQEINHEFDEKTRYYILKDGQYHSVKSRGSALKIFGEDRRELSQAMNKTKIRFKQNKEQYIVRLAEAYENLHD